jgi:hypothetical protein
MLTTTFRRLVFAGVVLAWCGLAQRAEATTIITFDDVITPGPGVVPVSFSGGLVLAYGVPNGTVPPIAFSTQGFDFGGLTTGVTVGLTFPNPSIVDPAVCAGGLTCTGHFLAHNQALSLAAGSGPNGFAIGSFDAASEPPGQQNPGASTINVFGFRGNNLVASQTFTLGANFQTFLFNNDPDWGNVNRVVFQPFTAAGGPGVVLTDNISLNMTPEPASLLLLGVGLAGIVARRFNRARR